MKHLSLFVSAVALLAAHCFSDEKPNPPSKEVFHKNHITGLWMMEQSLCDGSESLPLVTPSDSGLGNYMFKRGVRTWVYGNHADKPVERLKEQFAFVPSATSRLHTALTSWFRPPLELQIGTRTILPASVARCIFRVQRYDEFDSLRITSDTR